MLQFARLRTTPVIALGTTYDGWADTGLAAPSACWDGTRYVLTCSSWSTALSKWASLFFTSSDLETWTYVTGSLRVPTGSDYILGNGGIAFYGGKYFFSYSHYASSGGTINVCLDYSTDLLTWTNVANPLPSLVSDSKLVVNPNNGKLECWATTQSSPRVVQYSDTSSGTTAGSWTFQGTNYTPDLTWVFDTLAVGAAGAFYDTLGNRYLSFDISTPDGSGGEARLRAMAKTADGGTTWTTWTTNGSCLGWSARNSWEAAQAFDGMVLGPIDRGDGRGSCFWHVYAGGDVIGLTDNTHSGIGLAFLSAPVAYQPGGVKSGQRPRDRSPAAGYTMSGQRRRGR